MDVTGGKLLSEQCIKTICENTTNIMTFLSSTPLPWCLTKEIVKKYSNYRWDYLNKVAFSDQSRHLKCLEFIPCDKAIPSSLRNAVLATDGWGCDVFEESQYCIWVNRYVIERFNLLLCKSCYDILKVVQKKVKKSMLIVNDHYHDIRATDDIVNDLYQNKFYWCQSCYDEVLFEVKDETSCNLTLHPSRVAEPKIVRFRGRYDSDIDHIEYDW